MKFKVDENLPVEAVDLLRGAGYDASTVIEEHLGGKPDPEIASICQREDRALVTLDMDFADIRTYPTSLEARTPTSIIISWRIRQQKRRGD